MTPWDWLPCRLRTALAAFWRTRWRARRTPDPWQPGGERLPVSHVRVLAAQARAGIAPKEDP